jgi:hypothetical protein
MATSNLTIFESIAKELRCDEEGKGFCSLRGLARMCGVKSIGTWGKGDLFLTREIDAYLVEGGFEVSSRDTSKGIPDIIAAEVIGFYAEEKQSQTAKKYSRAFRSYGLRKAIQDAVGYKAPVKPRLTAEQIIELCCLPCPTTWQRRFPEVRLIPQTHAGNNSWAWVCGIMRVSDILDVSILYHEDSSRFNRTKVRTINSTAKNN